MYNSICILPKNSMNETDKQLKIKQKKQNNCMKELIIFTIYSIDIVD